MIAISLLDLRHVRNEERFNLARAKYREQGRVWENQECWVRGTAS